MKDTIRTKDGEKDILYQIPRVKRAKEQFPGIEFFVAQEFHSPRIGEQYWTLDWDDKAFRFDEDGMTESPYGNLFCNDLIHDIRPATDDQIAEFRKIRARIDGESKRRENKESKLLALCGLKHSDFVRFRKVYRARRRLVVETRENGIGRRSSKAIKNPNYENSEPDSGDPTYEYYTFKIPNKVKATSMTKSASKRKCGRCGHSEATHWTEGPCGHIDPRQVPTGEDCSCAGFVPSTQDQSQEGKHDAR